MELHPIKAVRELPVTLRNGLHELREVIIGPDVEIPTNEELSHAEETSFYRSRTANIIPSMSGSLNLRQRTLRKN